MNGARPSVSEAELHAYLDGEMAPERIETLERFFREHPQELARFRDYHEQGDLIRKVYGPLLKRPLPAGFALPALAEAAPQARPSSRRWLAALAAALALLLVGSAAGWLAQSYLQFGHDPALVRAASEAHRVYVVERRHPVEVPGSEEAHLVEWLSNRLGVSLAAPDLTEFGYQLIGGRLLPAVVGPAAQLMYESTDGRRLTLYVRPSGEEPPTGFRFEQQGELSAFYWREPDASFAVLAELSREELLPLARFIYTTWNA